MLEDSNALFEVLQELGAKKPYLKYPGLSKSGEKSYHKLVSIIYSLEKMGFEVNANEMIDKLDKIHNRKRFCKMKEHLQIIPTDLLETYLKQVPKTLQVRRFGRR